MKEDILKYELQFVCYSFGGGRGEHILCARGTNGGFTNIGHIVFYGEPQIDMVNNIIHSANEWIRAKEAQDGK